MRVLGIESSCDETGLAIYETRKGLVAHQLHSQVRLHQPFGGVVPELASRDHIKQLIPLLDAVLHEARLTKLDLDAIAYTAGPGLMGALLTGACFAKSLAWGLSIPSIAVHHLEAHLLAAQLELPNLQTPYLALLVSGGHTQLIAVRDFAMYHLLGETLDDAIGEAFDKTAKMMGLSYPGGPLLAKYADAYQVEQHGSCIPFPRPMTDRPGLDFSFSGLKTHALNTWMQSQQNDDTRHVIAHAFQEAAIDTLIIKCKRALTTTGYKTLVVAGGVGANRELRQRLGAYMQSVSGRVLFPKPEFCTDNGAMVAFAGWMHAQRGEIDADLKIDVRSRWPLSGA